MTGFNAACLSDTVLYYLPPLEPPLFPPSRGKVAGRPIEGAAVPVVKTFVQVAA
jgi:hypothetical protein